MKHLMLSLLLMAAGPGAWSAEATEAEQLRVQRAAIEARYEEALAQCAQRFAVIDCQLQAKQQRHEAIKPLQAREYELNAAERAARAEAQRQRVKAKQADYAERDARQKTQSLLAEPTPMQAEPVSKARPDAPDSNERGRQALARRVADEKAAELQRQQLLQREQAAQAHRQAVERRNAERAARKAPAAPLPLPSASAVSAAASTPGRAKAPAGSAPH
ncbi:hypothetical protein RQP53_04490 [Paucibacter sp. APW11]|uniref:DUF1090 domain-containing protein n=1 Tax=Roseateles aquae TaxID=3077235 RepID=A0ABU3P7K4_9BURK|nr:hypothetical protein [Paucibacter sp. APW11]MDT8998530.1 hypothetical protein [Paucibacter sp. APW11]